LFATFSETSFKKILDYQDNGSRKCGQKSKELRDAGNKLYSGMKNEEALKMYTRAVQFAPHEEIYKGRELSLGLANRSAVLFKLKEFKLALRDIEVSIEAGYPKDLIFNLHERRFKCFKELKQLNNAFRSAKDFIDSLNFSNLENEKREKFKKEYQVIVKQLKSKYGENPNISTVYEENELPKVSSPNKHFPAFSSCVDIRYEEKRGRFGVAARNIKLGEILCVESPSIFYICPDPEPTNCHLSTRSSKAPLPSPYSTDINFDSKKCFDQAQATFLEVESKVSHIFSHFCMKKKEWMLGLRAVTSKPLSYFTENRGVIEVTTGGDTNLNYGVGMKEDDLYTTEDLRSTCNLVTHHDTWDWSTLAYKVLKKFFFTRTTTGRSTPIFSSAWLHLVSVCHIL